MRAAEMPSFPSQPFEDAEAMMGALRSVGASKQSTTGA